MLCPACIPSRERWEQLSAYQHFPANSHRPWFIHWDSSSSSCSPGLQPIPYPVCQRWSRWFGICCLGPHKLQTSHQGCAGHWPGGKEQHIRNYELNQMLQQCPALFPCSLKYGREYRRCLPRVFFAICNFSFSFLGSWASQSRPNSTTDIYQAWAEPSHFLLEPQTPPLNREKNPSGPMSPLKWTCKNRPQPRTWIQSITLNSQHKSKGTSDYVKSSVRIFFVMIV